MRLFDMDSREDYLLDGKYKVATSYVSLIDFVKVVRCKDCKYWHSNTEFCDVWSFANVAQRTLADDYCSRGEHKGDSEA